MVATDSRVTLVYVFDARIEIIAVNPYVFVPDEILKSIFVKAKRDKGPIPVHGLINDVPFTQTLVRYAGEWRLYINTIMLKDSPKHVGEFVHISVDFDPRERTIPIHPKLREALGQDAHARQAFESLPASRRHEINRYITNLKSETKVRENVQRAVDHLNGKGRFVGRDR